MKKNNILVEIFARIWALWGIISFVATFLIIFIPSILTYLIPNPKGQDIFIKISKIWMTTWLGLILCRVRIRGKNNIEKGKTYIFTFNHNTFLDVTVSCPFIPGANKTIAKKSFTKIPLFGWYYAKGSVLVDRNNDASRRQSFEEMKQVIKQGMHMGIYPEGTRNKTQEPLKKFYDGAFKLAVDTKTDIIPSVLFNTPKALPTNRTFYLLPQILELHFLPAISQDGLTASELNKKVFNAMYQHYTTYKVR